mgnify:CR=1 FL=1
MLLPLDATDILLLVGIPRKRWQEIFSLHYYHKETEALSTLGKRYKINTNYFVPMGLSFDDLVDFQKYYGSMTVLKENIKKNIFPGVVKCKTASEDILNFLVMESSDEDKDKPFSYSIQYANCKLKNVINIKKTTSMNVFLKKLGVKQYNYNSKKHTIDFICGKCYCKLMMMMTMQNMKIFGGQSK